MKGCSVLKSLALGSSRELLQSTLAGVFKPSTKLVDIVPTPTT